MQRAIFAAAGPRSISRQILLRHQLRAASTAAATASQTAETAKEKVAEAADKTKATAEAAADKAKNAANSAAEGAQNYVNKAAASGSQVLNQLSSTASGLLGSYREPVVYNLAVVREVAKQVYIAEGLAPPTNLQVIRSAYEQAYGKASDASWWRSILESGEWKRLAIYALEAYGIFTIGEMIGRRHVIGYKLDE